MQSMTAAKRMALRGAMSRVVIAGLAGGLVAGCGMSSLTAGLGGGIFGGSTAAAPAGNAVTEEQLLSAAKADEGATGATPAQDVAYGCPRFAVWPRDNSLTIYEPGRVGDGRGVVHRGEITKTARECQVAPGQVTVKYGFSGRVLLGPQGKTATATFPVTIFVTDAKREKIATDAIRVDVALSVDNPISYFSAVKTVTFPISEGSRPGEYELFVGFDRKVPNSG